MASDPRETSSAAFVRRDRRLVITLDQEGPDHWIVDVAIDGTWVGDGTAPTASAALDVAMNVLYGDKNDWLNGDEGAIRKQTVSESEWFEPRKAAMPRA